MEIWHATVTSYTLLNIYMKKLKEGNLYNVEQSVTPGTGTNATKVGLAAWNREMRKQLMQKLKHYAPDQVQKIIKATFGDNI
jgi:hypothetical protein